jgi:hypothetical protein
MELVVKYNFSILKKSSKIAGDCMLAKAHIQRCGLFLSFKLLILLSNSMRDAKNEMPKMPI